jgi:hypothetical protein
LSCSLGARAKQKIKTFVGALANAVNAQIWTALTSMLVLPFLQIFPRVGWSLSHT